MKVLFLVIIGMAFSLGVKASDEQRKEAFCRLYTKIKGKEKSLDVKLKCDSGGKEMSLESDDGSIRLAVFSDESCTPVLAVTNVLQKNMTMVYLVTQNDNKDPFTVFDGRVVAANVVLNATEEDYADSDKDSVITACASSKKDLEDFFDTEE